MVLIILFIVACPSVPYLIDLYVNFADVVTIEKTGEYFRLIYDVKGRFAIHRITSEEAKVNQD
jgi:hypothetical protein